MKKYVYENAWLEDGGLLCPMHPIDKWLYGIAYENSGKKFRIILEEIED